jgi:serine/threonine protein kinase
VSELPREFGDYTLLKLLARGGMGEIYLARTQGSNGFEKYYAVKKLLKKFTNDNDVGARFIDEAKLGARLQHPNIVQVYDLGRFHDELYMATEFVDGFDLRRVLRFCHEKKKRIPLDIALFIVREILSGLAYAHRQVDAEGHSINLIHRDISPQNVLVSFEGEVKIIDFGLAKSTQRSQETQANVLLGNFGYMSPEQARGHPLDVRTDIYSAGIVLFELVTGTKRFVEENPLRLLEMVARPTPIVPSDKVPGSPKTIDKIYSKATSPNKEERFESAEAFRDDVTAALHKINPKASRENLAQFLNHLFLGGQAPAPVDADLLDKSVAIRVRDLYETSDAFQKPAESDVKDRRLSEFSDDAPQTASHALMRSARAGDSLTHQQLTGEDLSTPTAATGPAISAPQAAPPPSMNEPTADHGIVTAPRASVQNPMSEEAEMLSDDALLVDLDSPGSQGPTSVYDSPSWPGDLDRAAAAADPAADLQRELEAQERQRQTVPEPTRSPPPDQSGVHRAPKVAPATASPPPAPPVVTGKNTIVTTVGPPPKRPGGPDEQRPSIVVSMDLDPQEPTVVGASMPGPKSDLARTIEVQPITEKSSKSGGGFGDGGVHESLIIDFEDSKPAGTPAEQTDKSIRPAAQPLGKRVVPSVAQPKPRTTAPRTTQNEDTGPGTMPPPTNTRRR